MLRGQGYRNFMLGKWHVTPLTEPRSRDRPRSTAGRWGAARPVLRFRWTQETDQFSPELVQDNSHIDPPGTFADGCHLTSDLVDQAIRFIGHIAEQPTVPWMTLLSFGACHAPHQAPFDLIRSYDEMFSGGWDVEQERRLARQKELGLVPQDTVLPPINDSRQDRSLVRTSRESSPGCSPPMPPCWTMPTSTLPAWSGSGGRRGQRRHHHHRHVRQWGRWEGRAVRFVNAMGPTTGAGSVAEEAGAHR